VGGVFFLVDCHTANDQRGRAIIGPKSGRVTQDPNRIVADSRHSHSPITKLSDGSKIELHF
jgi:hypothetical protein